MTNYTNNTGFMTWNVLNGGGKRRARILGQIAQSKATVIGLTEVRGNNLEDWINGLKRLGYEYIETPCPEGKINSVLLASRVPIRRVQLESVEDPQRLVAVHIPSLDVEVLCVHIPGTPDDKKRPGTYSLLGIERKEMMWRAVVRYAEARKDKRVILLGDFNTGRNDIDKAPNGKPFKAVEFIDQLSLLGFHDTFRTLHPTSREYTWHSRSNRTGRELNGFRLDYVFVSTALRDCIVDAEHIDHVRGLVSQGGLSDHAIVIVSLDLVVALGLIA